MKITLNKEQIEEILLGYILNVMGPADLVIDYNTCSFEGADRDGSKGKLDDVDFSCEIS